MSRPASKEETRKIEVADLRVGMYVVRLDRPWTELPFEPPFQLQGFKVKSQSEIDKVKKYCENVFIDPRFEPGFSLSDSGEDEGIFSLKRFKGFLRRGKSSSEEVDEALPASLEILAEDAPDKVVYEDTATIEEEMAPARQLLEDADEIYKNVVDEVNRDGEIDVVKIEAGVQAMVDSVVRNADALSYLVKLKAVSEHTYNLAISSCVMSLAFGRHLGLSEEELKVLGIGALLQDLGMIRLPVELLQKTEALSPAEFTVIKKHTEASREMLEAMEGIPTEAIEIAHLHHERYDGSGYPGGLKRDEIPLLAMITGIVDTYMALLSDRPYRSRKTSYEALNELHRVRNKAFVGALVDRFIENIGIFPVGSFVKLNSGHVGIVVGRNRLNLLRPRVMLIQDGKGKSLESTWTINLASEQEDENFARLKITREIDPNEYNLDPGEFFAN